MCTLHAGRKATPVYIAEIIEKSGDGFLFGSKYRTRFVVVSTTLPVGTSDAYAVAMPAGASSWGAIVPPNYMHADHVANLLVSTWTVNAVEVRSNASSPG